MGYDVDLTEAEFVPENTKDKLLVRLLFCTYKNTKNKLRFWQDCLQQFNILPAFIDTVTYTVTFLLITLLGIERTNSIYGE